MHSAEKQSEELRICEKVDVGVTFESSPYVTVTELQRRAVVELRVQYGFIYSNAWTAALSFDVRCEADTPSCALDYVMSPGLPQYRVHFNKVGAIVKSERFSKRSGVPEINEVEVFRMLEEIKKGRGN